MDRFSQFFHQLIREKILYVYMQRLPPRESRKSKNVTDFESILNELLTCSWEHFEHLI